MSIRHVMGLSALTLVLGGCAPAVDVAEEESAIRASAASWLQMAAEGDAAGVAGLFAGDATLYWANRPATAGRADIEAFLAREFAEDPAGEGSFAPDRIDVAASGDLAVEQGGFQGPGGQGRYMTLHRKIDGQWRVQTDMSVGMAPDGGAPDWAQEMLERWYEAYNGRNAQGLADLYTADAKVGGVQGRAAIIRRYVEGWAENDESCSGAYDGWMMVGEVATGWGRDTCVTTSEDGVETVSARSNWIVVMEAQPDGTWLMIRDFGEEMGS